MKRMTNDEGIQLELESAERDNATVSDYVAMVKRSLADAESALMRSQSRLAAARLAAGFKSETTQGPKE